MKFTMDFMMTHFFDVKQQTMAQTILMVDTRIMKQMMMTYKTLQSGVE